MSEMNVEACCSTSLGVQRSRAFLIRKSRLGYEDLESLLQVLHPDRPGAVSLLRRACGVLPQHLDCICDVSDALDAPALAST